MPFISVSILRRGGIMVAGLCLFFAACASPAASGKLPLSFEPNLGQADPSVKFLARGPGYTLFLTEDGAVLVMHPGAGAANPLRLRFSGSNPSSEVTGVRKFSGKSNYFLGNKPGKWHADVPTYARVRYADIYPGVDLVYYGNYRGELEYDFIVKPGSDPGAITLAIAGEGSAPLRKGNAAARGASLRIAAGGDLVVCSGGGQVRFHKPVAYQGSRLISARYVLRPPAGGRQAGKPEREVGFAVAAYDPAKPLVIDPVLDYSTYLGGSDLDYAYGIAVDASGSAYVTGYTASVDFPLGNAAQPSPGSSSCAEGEVCFDAFVAKFNPAGTAVVYSTYFGGSGQDYGTKIAVDASGHAYVAGYTNSTDFPVRNALQAGNAGGYDAFAAELSADGASLVYSTYWGGSGDDLGYGIAVDSSGNAYMAGTTASPDFPVTPGAFRTGYSGGAHDGFLVKIEPGGAGPGFSTFLGGSADDYVYGVAVDGSGEAYVTGATNSSDLPTLNAVQSQYAGGTCAVAPNSFPCYDVFVAKLNPAGTGLLFSTFLGGTGSDYGYAIALDASSNAYVAGYTTSQDFPVTAGAFQQAPGGGYDAFVAKVESAGSTLAYSTYLGGSGTEVAYDIGVDSAGRAFVTGYNYGGNFPTAVPLQAKNAGFYDAVIGVLDATGSSLVFSTYLGGGYDEVGRGIAVDASGNGYVTGGTFSADFPVLPGGYQTSYGGGPYDAFVAKFNPDPSPSLAVSPALYDFGEQVIGTSSSAELITLGNTGNANLSLSGISAEGDFAVSQSCPNPLVPGASCVASVTFTPAAAGKRTGAMTITDNAPGSPQKVSLAGVGVAGFTLAADTDSVSIEPGTDSLTFTLTAASQDGYAGNITLACSGNSPAACLFNPGVITPGESSKLTLSGLSGLGTGSLAFSVVGTSGTRSVSTTILILVEGFSLAASPTRATVAAGGSASYTLSVSPINGFSLPVSFACSGAPPSATCSVSPALKAMNGTSAGSVTLEVQTTASSATNLRPPQPFQPRGKRPPLSFGVMALLAFVLAAGVKRACGNRPGAILAFTLPLLLACLACGGGGESRGPGSSVSGTPAGTYTLTVTATATSGSGASSSFSRTTAVTLTVQ